MVEAIKGKARRNREEGYTELIDSEGENVVVSDCSRD
jgi:hypothetical protein